MGVVALPSRVTGLVAISIMAEITFMPRFQGSSNSSQRELIDGFSCRLIFRSTVLSGIRISSRSFCYVVSPRSRRNQRGIHRIEFKAWLIRVGGEISFRGFQPVL